MKEISRFQVNGSMEPKDVERILEFIRNALTEPNNENGIMLIATNGIQKGSFEGEQVTTLLLSANEPNVCAGLFNSHLAGNHDHVNQILFHLNAIQATTQAEIAIEMNKRKTQN